jgi:hypothetical protein
MQCTGLNDSIETTDQTYTAEGVTDLRDCLNVTVTPSGKLVKINQLSQVLAVADTVDISAGTDMFVTAGTVLKKFDGTNLVTLTGTPTFNNSKGKFIHTPIDSRFEVAAVDPYVSKNGTTTAAACALGTYAGPQTFKSFSRMQDFDFGFVFSGRLFTVKGKFLQFSEKYNYDVFNVADDYFGFKDEILQAGQIPGCIILMHKDSITTLVGSDVGNFIKTTHACRPLVGTLWSGTATKVVEDVHVFTCADGIHIVGADGKLANLSVERTDRLDRLNTVYNTAIVTVDGKYLAYGDSCCIEYDFVVKSVLIRNTQSILASCRHKGEDYFATPTGIYRQSGTMDATSICTVALPYNDFGNALTKHIRYIYFTGELTGAAEFITRNQFGGAVTHQVNNLGYVQNHKIGSFRTCRGNKLSVEINVTDGRFKLEELTASYTMCSSRL